MRKTVGLAVGLAFLFSSLYAEEINYTDYSFARLSYITGKTYIQRAAELSYEEGVANMPIAEGDRLGTTEGRAEIYLGKGNYVRLDHNTKIDFLKLPDKGNDLTQIQIWSGNIYSRIDFLGEEKDIEIHTPDVSVYLLEKGLYRIDMREGRETEIFVFQGLIEAAGESESVLVKDEQRLEAIQGHFNSRPAPFHAVAEDSFDRWSEYRDSQTRKRLAKTYLPEELGDFEYELAAYGDWAYIRPYGYVWVPGGIEPHWRPYHYGRWLWLPACGWTWLPYEPWGWVTFHYGRWHWSAGAGWYWIPTIRWGPAWVSWYRGYDYIGWAPLSYYNRPVVIINNVFYDRYEGAYYPHDSRVLTVIHKNQLRSPNISKVALSQESIKGLGKIELDRKPVSIRPAKEDISLEKLGKDRVFLRKKETSSVEKLRESLSRSSLKEYHPADIRKVRKDQAGGLTPSSERRIIKRKIGYPSSPEIRDSTYIKKDSRYIRKTRESDSVLGRIFRYISGGKSIKSRSSESSSRSSSREKVSSDSSSKRSSSPTKKSSSSSTKSKSGSKKVKKKKH
ncbi:MAG: DUF6600 domain-containing protein [Candidatus Aminicenantes bacterium]